MDSNMDRTKHMLNYLYPLVRRANPKLHDFMVRSVFYMEFLLVLSSGFIQS